MSTKEFKLITFEEFAQYLNSLAGEHTCPICCEEAWTLYTPNELTPGDDENRPREGANKQVISSQADSLIKISRIWADFFPANTSN